MPTAPHTLALPFSSADHPGERRQRHTIPGSSAILAVPVGIHGNGPHPCGPASPDHPVSASPRPMGRVIHMAAVGVWAVILNGRLAELDGIMHWPTQEALKRAAARAQIALSDLVTNTGQAV